MKVRIEPLPDGAHKRAGKYDNAARWYPYDEFVVPGTFGVRSPSRKWPFSYLKHFYTKAYAKRLFLRRPALYLDLCNISVNSEEGKRLIAAYAAERIKAS